MASESELRSEVMCFFDERGYTPEASENLFESGTIDSMGIIELIACIEDATGVQMDSAMMTAENFCTVDNIVQLFSASTSE